MRGFILRISLKERIKIFLGHTLIKLFRNNRNIDRKMKKILLIFPYGLGNTVLANGAIKSLRKAFPDASMSSVYMQEPTEELLSIIGLFQGNIYFNENNHSLKNKMSFILDIRKEKFDIVLTFFENKFFLLNFLSFIAGIPNRIGFELKNGFSHIFLTHFVKYDYSRSEFENNLELLTFFNIPYEKSITFSVEECNVPKHKKDGKVKIGLHVGKENRQRPGWLSSNFVELANLIKENYSAEIFIFGGAAEKDRELYFNEKLGNIVVNLIGELTLKQTIYYISLMDLFISNDTGLMHLAASQEVPLIAIFGPTDKIKSQPILQDQKKLKIISKEVSCQPCYPSNIICNSCKCITDIKVKEVFLSVTEMLSSCYGLKEKGKIND